MLVLKFWKSFYFFRGKILSKPAKFGHYKHLLAITSFTCTESTCIVFLSNFPFWNISIWYALKLLDFLAPLAKSPYIRPFIDGTMVARTSAKLWITLTLAAFVPLADLFTQSREHQVLSDDTKIKTFALLFFINPNSKLEMRTCTTHDWLAEVSFWKWILAPRESCYHVIIVIKP